MTAAEQAYQLLDEIALASGTDKSSEIHNYVQIYASLFDKIRNEPLKFLEIGVGNGNSILLWQQYFPKAELHFMDIADAALDYPNERVHFHFGDQAAIKDLKRVIETTGGGFDVILDDGGHEMQQQQVSFAILFPHLKSGGMYIIEDLHTSYWDLYGGEGSKEEPKASPRSTTEFLKKLVDELNFVGAATGYANHDTDLSHIRDKMNFYREKVFSITFYDSLCVVVKR